MLFTGVTDELMKDGKVKNILERCRMIIKEIRRCAEIHVKILSE